MVTDLGILYFVYLQEKKIKIKVIDSSKIS